MAFITYQINESKRRILEMCREISISYLKRLIYNLPEFILPSAKPVYKTKARACQR